MRLSVIYSILAALLLFVSCGSVKYVTVKETEYVTVRDSVFFRDTTIKYQIEKERYTDYAGLLDTLRLSTEYASAETYIDTTANLLKGRIENKPEKEIQIKWKEKVVYRDSLIYKEKPYPVEVIKEVKHTPFFTKVLAWIGGLSLLALALYFGLKFIKF